MIRVIISGIGPKIVGAYDGRLALDKVTVGQAAAFCDAHGMAVERLRAMSRVAEDFRRSWPPKDWKIHAAENGRFHPVDHPGRFAGPGFESPDEAKAQAAAMEWSPYHATVARVWYEKRFTHLGEAGHPTAEAA